MISTKRLVARYSAQRQAATDMATRFEGLCAFCNKRQRVQGYKLVLHGYKRPGHGSTEGRCPGAGNQPYEMSPITAAIGVTLSEREIDYLTMRQAVLKEHPDDYTINVSKSVSWGVREMEQKPLSEVIAERYPIKPDATDADRERIQSIREYEREKLIKSTERELKGQMESAEFFLNAYKKLVDDWKPMELETFEEALLKQKRLKQENADKKLIERDTKYKALKEAFLKRFVSSFDKLKVDEAKFRTQTPAGTTFLSEKARKIAEALYDRYDDLLDKLRTNVPKLREKTPQGTRPEAVLADLGIDDTLKHLGILKNGVYEIPKRDYSLSPSRWLSVEPGKHWKPYWPGYENPS